ncbi:MAG: ATP-binding protein, partial [Flavobacteriales bacterium]
LEAEAFYVDPTQRARLVDSLEKQPFVKNLEVMFKKKNGEVFWGLVSTTKTQSFDGEVLYDGSIRDISSIKEMERLLRSEKQKALAASKSKEEFLSIVSHELKTPLNAVVGMANVLLQNEPRKDQLESLNVMTFSANSLLSLINDILDFSKIKTGKIDLELRNTDFRDLLKNIVRGFQELIKPKALTMRLEVSDDIPQELMLDSSRLNQVLNNLIGNACKFTFHGEIAVVVSKVSESNNKVVLLFEVMDTGVGIPDQKKDLIFESFSQVSSTNTREFGGTGLGLTISKQLVGLMGGRLEVTSEVGFGSNFHFELELIVPEASISHDSSQEMDQEVLKLKGAKILAVEDNEVNQILLQRYAEMW